MCSSDLGDLMTLNVESTKGIRVHDRAFKIFDAQLAAHAQTFFAEPSANKILISAHVEAQPNNPLRLKLTDGDGNISEAETKTAAVAATNRPLDRSLLEKQIGRLARPER